MSYKNIERSREIRLWIGQIIIPVLTTGLILAANPHVRKFVKDKYSDAKEKIKMTFSKGDIIE